MDVNQQFNQVFKPDFCSEFLRGQQDCIDGVEHKDQGESYNRGYSAQHDLEQVKAARYG